MNGQRLQMVPIQAVGGKARSAVPVGGVHVPRGQGERPKWARWQWHPQLQAVADSGPAAVGMQYPHPFPRHPGTIQTNTLESVEGCGVKIYLYNVEILQYHTK